MNANRKLADRCAMTICTWLDLDRKGIVPLPYTASYDLKDFILQALTTQETRHKRLLRKLRTAYDQRDGESFDRLVSRALRGK